MGSLSYFRVSMRPLSREFQTVASLGMQFEISNKDGVLDGVQVKSTVVVYIKSINLRIRS